MRSMATRMMPRNRVSFLLSLLPSVRQLVEDLEDAESRARTESERAALLQGKVLALEDRMNRQDDLLEEATSNERRTYQMNLNLKYQQEYGIKPFPGAPCLSDSFTKGNAVNGAPQFINGREMARRGDAVARAAIAASLEPLSGDERGKKYIIC